MKPYSSDLVWGIVDAYQNDGALTRQLAIRFKVSSKFVPTLLQCYCDTGSIAPKPHAGGPDPSLQAPELEVLE